jgi:outer membrane protein OmpA-like peptidoglycan-associated protein
MKSKIINSYKWAYLPVVFTSAAVLFTPVMAGQYETENVQQVGSLNHQFVGGRTQVGVSVTDDGSASADVNHIFSETKDSSTSGGLWAGFDLDGEEKGIDSGGVQINHNWVSRDAQGRASHVNKVFGAYDQSSTDDAKVTVGYGQEREDLFWEGHVSKGLSDKRLVKAATDNNKAVYEKAFDYGAGASVGTFLAGSNTRVRGGLDYQWGTETGTGEEDAQLITVSAGVEQFFQGTPHSVGLDVAASKKQGGYEYAGSDDVSTSANLSYRYDFGGDNIYQPDQRYRRVRVEVPGKGRSATYAKKPIYTKKPIYKTKPVFKNQPIYKKQPIYVNKTVRVPVAGHMAKSTVELEGQTFFKYGSAVLIPSAKQRLRQISNEIRKHGYKGNIRITGNTCGLPDPRKDQALSQQRANAVKHFMISQGFNPQHLDARGIGGTRPKFSKANEDFKNRRVDIEYVTERQQKVGGGFRNETKRVQNGFKNVISGYKRVQVGTQNVEVGVRNVQTGTTDIQVSQGAPGAPRVIWRTEPVNTAPAWVTRALRSNISHNRSVDTYTTTAGSESVTTVGNTGPIAINDTTTIELNQTVDIHVLNNDSDVDGDNLTITEVSSGSEGGDISIVNNQIRYTPAVDFVGVETITYVISDGSNSATATVTVTIKGGSEPTSTCTETCTVANMDDVLTDKGSTAVIDVLANDTGNGLQIVGVSQGQNGSVKISGNKVTYTPKANFVGNDVFWYAIKDASGTYETSNKVMVYVDDLK